MNDKFVAGHYVTMPRMRHSEEKLGLLPGVSSWDEEQRPEALCAECGALCSCLATDSMTEVCAKVQELGSFCGYKLLY